MSSTPKDFDAIVIGELNVDIILNDIGSMPVIGREIMAGSMVVTIVS